MPLSTLFEFKWEDIDRVTYRHRRIRDPSTGTRYNRSYEAELEFHNLEVLCPVCGGLTSHCGALFRWVEGVVEGSGWVCTRRIYVHDSVGACFSEPGLSRLLDVEIRVSLYDGTTVSDQTATGETTVFDQAGNNRPRSSGGHDEAAPSRDVERHII